ncbi:SPOSA6832_03594 [Sporobolomyces salmonicolor]|uniref:SPOSA6832_03594-mRNA-1:cds n=1 Tax=Sporidiobolus salmonicolor TaxID=5005 RepID=A0A0D6EPX8_SPOSA|nr:SPOSA6832_03594 [Sporobolomyces salmonicolor]
MSSAHLAASKLFSVKGLTAVVTGGGTGIGLMATQVLAANGAKVYIIGRRTEKLENVVKTYGGDKISGEIIPLQGDVTSKDDLKRLAEEVKSREGGIHILVNNAGISGEVTKLAPLNTAQEIFDAHWKEQTMEGWTDVFRTNAFALFYSTIAFLPLLEKNTWGKDPAGKEIYENYQTGVVNITSISGLVKSAQNHFAYNASKAAATHLQRMLATEIGPKTGIRFNAIAPGVFPSGASFCYLSPRFVLLGAFLTCSVSCMFAIAEMTGSGSDENNKTSLEGEFDPKSLNVPANRAGTDEDMAGTILYLCSRAGQYTNGVILPVDGGTLSTNPSSY